MRADLGLPPKTPESRHLPSVSARAVIASIFWILTLLGAVLGILIVLPELAPTAGVRQSSAASVALALVVIPYCCARAVSEIGKG